MSHAFDRTSIIDKNFTDGVLRGQFPEGLKTAKQLSKKHFFDLFHSQLVSRHVDLQARYLKEKNQGYYTIASCGHEGNAAIASAFNVDDIAFLHYRSGAFMLQRAKQYDSDPRIRDHLLALVAAKDDPCSGGRHKVFGNKDLFVPPQTSTIASHLPKAVGCALSIIRGAELSIDTKLPKNSVVLCSFGDGSVNHSVAQGAFNSACWIAQQHYPLPLVFICEDNGLSISVPTPDNWIASQFLQKSPLHYIAADGLDLNACYQAASKAQAIAREHRQPVFLHMTCVRLMGHAGSDLESQYRSVADIEAAEFNDPLLHSARIILENHGLSADDLIGLYEQARKQVAHEAEQVMGSTQLNSADQIMEPLIPKKDKPIVVQAVSDHARKVCFGETFAHLSKPRNMAQQINYGLTDLMLQFNDIVVFGEDVGKKGGVYHVTDQLQQRFGQRRVFDTLLDETTILGAAIGMAHNGFLPIPEIQFLAYLHNAEDQLRGEAATLSFFSQQQFVNPMVVRIASFAYQKGFGGHFHNDNSIAVLRDIPGIIIACPSNGEDAAKMLRTCVVTARSQGRVVVFLEPIALYMQKDLFQAGDNRWLGRYPDPLENIVLGEIHVEGKSEQLAILSYANGYYLSLKAREKIRQQYNIDIKVIDLRWLAPLPEKAIFESTVGVSHVLIVDECRKTGSVSEALMTLFVEKNQTMPKLSRITAKDSFIPLGEAAQRVLPSCDDIVGCIKTLLDLKEN